MRNAAKTVSELARVCELPFDSARQKQQRKNNDAAQDFSEGVAESHAEQ